MREISPDSRAVYGERQGEGLGEFPLRRFVARMQQPCAASGRPSRVHLGEAAPFTYVSPARGRIGPSPSSPGECEAFGRRFAASTLRCGRFAITATHRCGAFASMIFGERIRPLGRFAHQRSWRPTA